MTNLRGNVGYIIGSAIAGAGVFLSWLLESVFFNTVASVGLGIVIALWTQKIIWKREESIKRVEQVYSPLYGLIKDFIADKERREYLRRGFVQWGEMQKDYRYFMVDKKFSEKLDNFSERVAEFDTSCYKLNNEVLASVLKKTVKEVFHMETEDTPQLSFDYKMNNQTHSYALNTVSHLKKLETLSEIAEDALQYYDRSKISDISFSIDFAKSAVPKIPPERNQQKINEYWELCRKRLKENETFKFVIDENEKLLEEARKIEKELTKHIEETWRK